MSGELKKDFACGVIAVRKESDKFLFLIVDSAKGYWGFPKGHQDAGESETETAKRELYEETGIRDIELTDKKFLCNYIFEYKGEKFDKDVIFFLGFARESRIDIPKEFSHEITDARWVDCSEAKKLFDYPHTQKVLKEANEYLLANF